MAAASADGHIRGGYAASAGGASDVPLFSFVMGVCGLHRGRPDVRACAGCVVKGRAAAAVGGVVALGDGKQGWHSL
jgi:hypothetical protein